MDGMYSAIKNRRGGLLNDDEENAHQMPMEKKAMGKPSGEMQSLIAQLDDTQKMELLKLLSADVAAADSREIEKGGMGPGEMMELAEEAGEVEGMGETEDEIAADMVSSADMTRAEQNTKPRNLGERARIEMAKKLKTKKGV
jgi:hypothetical protein